MILIKQLVMWMMALIAFSLLSCSSSGHKMAMEASQQDSIGLKDSIAAVKTYEFEKDSLSASSLKAFELRAIQKLYDVADYIQILSDRSIDKSFRIQAKQMMFDVFSDASNTISFSSNPEESLEKISISDFLDKMLASQFPKLKMEINQVKTVQGLQRKDKDTYEGQLTFHQVTYRIDPTRKVKLNEHQMKANISLARITKTFGTTTKEVWIVFLGNTEVVPIQPTQGLESHL
jgi:hypothetical protein